MTLYQGSTLLWSNSWLLANTNSSLKVTHFKDILFIYFAYVVPRQHLILAMANFGICVSLKLKKACVIYVTFKITIQYSKHCGANAYFVYVWSYYEICIGIGSANCVWGLFCHHDTSCIILLLYIVTCQLSIGPSFLGSEGIRLEWMEYGF